MEEADNKEEASRIFMRALRLYPNHGGAAERLAKLQQQDLKDKSEEQFALTSKAPITLNFRQADMKLVLEFIAKSFGLNIVFDESVKSAAPVTVFAKDVTFEQALGLILATTKMFHKKISRNTILIAPDTKEKRGEYENYILRTFYLTNARAKDMADILRGLIPIKKIIVNEHLNTLVLRDTEEVMRQVEKLVSLNDIRPAEMILEVEILEMNRTKAERLGLDLGSYSVGASLSSPGTIPLVGSISNAIKNTAVLTLPSATFRFFKQDVDARTLANPKIRVLNGKSAKIHIGDNVPLRASTIVNVTGQVNTTYDYKQIGIKLNVEPTINLDNSATVKLGLEVSSLGANLGTAAEPAYQIGTRNAETFMLLRDGETAVLGGLIRDDDRNTIVKVPLLGDIPVVGSLFSSYDNSKQRTDVLLTITPRIVRGWELPAKDARQFYSGTDEKYLNEAPFKNMSEPLPLPIKEKSITPDALHQQEITNERPLALSATLGATSDTTPSANTNQLPVLTFSQPVYMDSNESDISVKLVAENIEQAGELSLELQYNPQLLQFVDSEPGDLGVEHFQVDAKEAGRVHITFGRVSGFAPNKGNVLATVKMHALKTGISNVTYGSVIIKNAVGEVVNAQTQPTRVIVK